MSYSVIFEKPDGEITLTNTVESINIEDIEKVIAECYCTRCGCITLSDEDYNNLKNNTFVWINKRLMEKPSNCSKIRERMLGSDKFCPNDNGFTISVRERIE